MNNDGTPIYGTVKVEGHEFVTTISAAQLLRMTVDPRQTEDPKRRDGNPQLEAIFRMRQEVQRLFEGAKEKNVESYAKYICNIQKGEIGVTPSIVLYTPHELAVVEERASLPSLILPWDVDFVAIDGETQLAARFEAAKMDPETKKQKVDIKICYHQPIEWAKQAFHDLNLLSVRPNAATAIAMDMRDPLTSITRKVADIPFFKGRVAQSRQLKKNSNEIFTLSVLRTAVVCFAQGIAGLQHGNRPIAIDPKQVPLIEASAVEYFRALADCVGPAMNRRNDTVAATPAVMAALGAVGHELSEISSEVERKAKLHSLMQKLVGVNWERGPEWDGIAGKLRPDGVFSTAGGAKDSGHTCYAAIDDPNSPHYYKVRSRQPLAV